VPIIDLRARFGLEKIEYGANTVIIVLKIMLGEVGRTVGLIVDGVSDVRNVNADQLKPAPDLGDAVNVEFLKGMAAIEDRMVILLDVDKLLEGDATLISSHVPAGGKAGVSSRS
jgi:purine-binding chemotaxis protein CheW